MPTTRRKNLQLKCEQTCREIRRSHSLVDKEIASLGDLARAQEKCWVGVSFQARVGQVKEVYNRQKQIQEQELNQLKGYLTQKLDELSLKLTRKFALYERDIRRLKVENRTLKGQVKLWQSATLMIIALVWGHHLELQSQCVALDRTGCCQCVALDRIGCSGRYLQSQCVDAR